MELQLTRPICFFDLETTGVNISKDRIVEIAILKVMPNGNKESKTWLVNPEMPIPAQTTAVHGITDEKVANEPTFKELAPEVSKMIAGCDLGGYNSNKFDIPLLAEEMLRVGLDFDMTNNVAVDVQNIFHKMEQRTLVAAYKFYCDKDLTNAHSAEFDTLATYEVLKSQLDKYPELENDTKFLAEFSSRRKTADFAGFIAYDDEDREVFTFGKHKGKLVNEVLEKEPGYFGWIQNADFPLYTKKILTAHIEELENEKPSEPVIFMKPDTAILLKKQPFFIPDFSDDLQYEAELIVKINKIGKHISPKFAHKYYDEISVGIDFTARDLQTKLKNKGLPWECSKAFDGSAVIGKWIQKSSLNKNMDDLNFELEKNDEKVQQGFTKLMLYSVDELIAYVSQFFTLKIGDIIFTGTPAGVGKVVENDRLKASLEGQEMLHIKIK